MRLHPMQYMRAPGCVTHARVFIFLNRLLDLVTLRERYWAAVMPSDPCTLTLHTNDNNDNNDDYGDYDDDDDSGTSNGSCRGVSLCLRKRVGLTSQMRNTSVCMTS